ncbi:nuclear transport factor 2 family protein [Phytohabitans flavus]|uniref:Ketosteroid isomerase n=1 Tax=Phytohabitans flavus TaxID=1076124 RepID=A0A6F8XS09_9ACTN|nr:nuclear transport factor 2 family protein [Phytohabitans flavus]BCB76613.1 ketosteroid isomerase [Phytohabitans flavus]
MTDATDVVRAHYGRMASGDVPGALATLSPDVEWVEAAGFPYAGTYHGPEAVVENVFARIGAEWDGFKVVPDVIVGDGDVVAALGWYSGTYKATGKAFEARYVHWFTVTGGRISRFEQVTDTSVIAAALS